MNSIKELCRKWKPRRATSHKGNFGRVFVLAGSRGFTGAAHLAAMGCLRTGAGLVTVGVPEKIYTIVARREAEIMVRPFPSTRYGTFSERALRPVLSYLKTQDVLAIGPGLSRNPRTQKLIRGVLEKSRCPVVIDADAINALKGHMAALRRCSGRAVITPHPGEFTRVFGGALTGSDPIRKKRASEAAMMNQVVMVLKGHHTVIASAEGRTCVNPTGNPGMATAGSGDVLTGMIAALVGQGFSLFDAARVGVYLHGLAGDLARKHFGETSLVAGDILTYLPQAVLKACSQKRL